MSAHSLHLTVAHLCSMVGIAGWSLRAGPAFSRSLHRAPCTFARRVLVGQSEVCSDKRNYGSPCRHLFGPVWDNIGLRGLLYRRTARNDDGQAGLPLDLGGRCRQRLAWLDLPMPTSPMPVWRSLLLRTDFGAAFSRFSVWNFSPILSPAVYGGAEKCPPGTWVTWSVPRSARGRSACFSSRARSAAGSTSTASE